MTAIALAWTSAAPAASFDCSKARSVIERQICDSDELSQLDERLERHYRGALHVLSNARECLRQDQRAWLRARNACTDETCLRESYLRRLAALDALQPGANAITDLELPDVPALVWIIPPAEDEVAVPRGRTAQTHDERTGKIIDELDEGGELLLETEQGERIALTLLLTADQDTIATLVTLAKTEAHYAVRGTLLTDEEDVPAFDASRCVFISRVPR